MPSAQNTSRSLAQTIHHLFNSLLKHMLRPTDKKSRREYSHGPVGEFWCSLSNIPFFIVALYFLDIPLFLAATFSLLSHAIPRQGLHDLDILGIGLVGIKVLLGIPILMTNPLLLTTVMGIGAFALIINLFDTYLSRNHYDKIGPWFHVAWHLIGAAAMFAFNAAVLNTALGLTGIFSLSITPLIPAICIGTGIVAATMLTVHAAQKLKNENNDRDLEKSNPDSSNACSMMTADLVRSKPSLTSSLLQNNERNPHHFKTPIDRTENNLKSPTTPLEIPTALFP